MFINASSENLTVISDGEQSVNGGALPINNGNALPIDNVNVLPTDNTEADTTGNSRDDKNTNHQSHILEPRSQMTSHDFANAFEQLIRSLRHYESRSKGFGIPQYEKWRNKYPSEATVLDKHGFNLSCLGIFIYTHIMRGETRMWYDFVVNMNIKRAERSEWYIQLMEAISDKESHKFTSGSLPFESQIESMPNTSKMSSVSSGTNNQVPIDQSKLSSIKMNVLTVEAGKADSTYTKSTPDYKTVKAVNTSMKKEFIDYGVMTTKTRKNLSDLSSASETCVHSSTSASNSDNSSSSESSDCSTQSEGSIKQILAKPIAKNTVVKQRAMTKQIRSNRDETSDDDEPSVNVKKSKKKITSDNSSENLMLINALKSLTMSSTTPAIDMLKSHKQDVVEWFNHFELVAKSLGWDNDSKANKLPIYLKGEALHIWQSMSKKKSDYDYAKKKLLKKLVAKDADITALHEFTNMSQKCDESVRDFSRRLRKTAKKTDTVIKEKMLVSQFLRGVNNEIRLAISAQVRNKTLKQTTAIADGVESPEIWLSKPQSEASQSPLVKRITRRLISVQVVTNSKIASTKTLREANHQLVNK
jgi:hypothetical protein